MGHKARTHQSKFKGANKHGGGPNAPVGRKDGKPQEPKPFGRFLKYDGGAVPSAGRTSEEQLAHLDSGGFRAVKERAKLKLRIEEAAELPMPNTPKKGKKGRKHAAELAAKVEG